MAMCSVAVEVLVCDIFFTNIWCIIYNFIWANVTVLRYNTHQNTYTNTQSFYNAIKKNNSMVNSLSFVITWPC
jgi:hypothetical protein